MTARQRNRGAKQRIVEKDHSSRRVLVEPGGLLQPLHRLAIGRLQRTSRFRREVGQSVMKPYEKAAAIECRLLIRHSRLIGEKVSPIS